MPEAAPTCDLTQFSCCWHQSQTCRCEVSVTLQTMQSMLMHRSIELISHKKASPTLRAWHTVALAPAVQDRRCTCNRQRQQLPPCHPGQQYTHTSRPATTTEQVVSGRAQSPFGGQWHTRNQTTLIRIEVNYNRQQKKPMQCSQADMGEIPPAAAPDSMSTSSTGLS